MPGKITWLLIVLLLYYWPASGQYYNQQENFLKANSVWAFGPTGAGLDFNSGSPVAIRTAAMNSWEGCASIADSTGQLLFYLSQVGTIYNRNHVPMLNGTGLYPNSYNSSSTQGALIIPVIDTPGKYYVLTNTAIENYQSSLPPYQAYSVVDMTLDNSLGAVESGRKNIPLYHHALGEGMIAIPGENCDIWLLTRTSNSYPAVPADPNIPGSDTAVFFLAWHITQNGIDPNPVVSSLSGRDLTRSLCMAVSPNKQRIAITTWSPSRVLLYKFDPATGIVSEELPVNTIDNNYGVCFSPDNTKLYTSSYSSTTGGIRQYDISTHNLTAITSSEYVVALGNSNAYVALKLYNDTLYTVRYGMAVVDRINNPNAPGAACNYQANVLPLLPGTSIQFGLPNEVVFPVLHNESFILHETICYTEESGYVPKTLAAPAGFASYKWDNGATGNSREVATSGVYWVKYSNDACTKYTDTFYMKVVDLTFSFGEDKTVLFCDHPASYLQLEVNIPHDDAAYRWQDGGSDHHYRVTEPGTYWVEVSKAGCFASDTVKITGVEDLDFSDTTLCKGDPIDVMLHTPDVPAGTIIQWSTGSPGSSIQVTDTGLYWVNLIYPPCILSDSAYIKVEVCECFAHVPNAFSPNGDGVNDYFLPMIEQGCPVRGYAFSVYNRFGERLFFSADPAQGWNGYYKGKQADASTYFYYVRFEGGTKDKAYYYKGDVVLIR
jgi:gliding motility-associated-like protein